MRKPSYDEVKKAFEDAGCTLVTTEYINSTQPLEYYCSCDHNVIETIKFNSFKVGCRCKKCHKSRLNATVLERYGVTHLSQREGKKEAMLAGMMKYIEAKKRTIEDISREFEQNGCTLLSKEYVDNKGKLDVIFECGHTGKISYNKFQKGERCSNKSCVDKKVKETSIKLFGVPSYTQTDEYQEARKETSMTNYGVDHYRKTEECQQRLKEHFMEKYGVEHWFQTDQFRENQKQWCLEKYGVEYYAQTDEMKAKVVNTNLLRYGFPSSFQHESVKEKVRLTNMQRYGVPYTLMDKQLRLKSHQRIFDIYGVFNVSQNAEIQARKMATSLARYGVEYPMQDVTIQHRSQSRAFTAKPFSYPSGNIVKVQGYEHHALNLLLEHYDEDDITTGLSNMPEFWYHGSDNKYHRYFPDIYIKKDNLIIEVKSTYTAFLNKDKIRLTGKTVKYNGYNFMLMVFDKNGKLLTPYMV